MGVPRGGRRGRGSSARRTESCWWKLRETESSNFRADSPSDTCAMQRLPEEVTRPNAYVTGRPPGLISIIRTRLSEIRAFVSVPFFTCMRALISHSPTRWARAVCLFAPVSVRLAISDSASRRLFDFCVLFPRILVPLIPDSRTPYVRIFVPLMFGFSYRVFAHLRDERPCVEVRVGEGVHLEYSQYSLGRRHATTTHQMQRAAHSTRRAHFTRPAGVSPLSCGRGEPTQLAGVSPLSWQG